MTTTRLPCPTLAGNLLENGDWETGTNDGWYVFRYGAVDPAVTREAAEACQFGFKARAQSNSGTYFHMFHRIDLVMGKSYTFQGSYKFLTNETDCFMKVSAPGMPETDFYNTPAIIGTWQKFTINLVATESPMDIYDDVMLLINCNNPGPGKDIMYLDNWSMVAN
jgi:hypothetical protein